MIVECDEGQGWRRLKCPPQGLNETTQFVTLIRQLTVKAKDFSVEWCGETVSVTTTSGDTGEPLRVTFEVDKERLKGWSALATTQAIGRQAK